MPNARIRLRKDIPESDKWNLEPLFGSDGDWKILYDEMCGALGGYDRYKGRLKESAPVLADAIEFDLAVSRKIDRLYTYAHLKSDQDKSDSVNLGLLDQAATLYTRAGEQSSFIAPEIQAVPDHIMAAFQNDDVLKPYRFYLEQILRLKPHTLDPKTEKILAMTLEMAQAPARIFGQLDNADMNFGSIVDENGHEIELSHGNFITFLMNPDRELRKRAFFQYYEAYNRHRHTISAALSHSSKKDLFYARVRNYGGCREAALFGDNVPPTVYETLVTTVKNNLDPLFGYLRFRRESLGVQELHIYDTYVPLVSDTDFHMTYEEAVEIAGKALAPLGDPYVNVLVSGLKRGWVDRYENRGKRSGAYSSGCYDSPPYILLNYEARNIGSLYTLVHEAGHAMHSYLSNLNQPYVYHRYTIFAAEVASTFNEVLLSRFLLEKYRHDPRMSAYILNREIDNIRATLFRQTMFAEFEHIIHTMAEQNLPLTVDALTDQYRKLLETYFGETLRIDPELHLECLRIPHFYSAFYVYKYATGISAAIALAEKVLSGDSRDRDAYLHFLSLGGSRFALDALLEAGVDLRSPEPIERAVGYFAELTHRLMQVLGK